MGKDPKTWRMATKLVRGGHERSAFKETSEALFLTSGFVYDSAEEGDARFAGTSPGYQYTRLANPTIRAFEERLALMEDAQTCRATATGMAAVTASLLGFLKAGDKVVAGRALFGSCRWVIETLLPRFGVTTVLVDAGDLDQWRAEAPGARLLFLETPTNPMLDIADIGAIAAIGKECGALTVVDNVFATPVLQKPLALGADIVVYSTTKHVDGQGRTLGGAILGSKALIEGPFDDFLRNTGPTMSPFNAWVQLKALETIEMRVRRQSESAARIADALAGAANVVRVRYPFRADHPGVDIARRQMSAGGTLVAFVVAGDREGAFRMLNALSLIDISNNLGDAKSLAVHPATTTHRRLERDERARLGVEEGAIRLSVGLEDPDDLIEDLLAALQAI